MKLFLSWSGAVSLEMAQALRDFLPEVLEGLNVFLSGEDIRKGADWLRKIREELDATDFGILCLTREALPSPWLLFEAGAIAKRVELGHVVPIYLGLAPADVVPPLSVFQGMRPEKAEFHTLVRQMNQAHGPAALPDERLTKRFEMWWPRLEGVVDGVLKKAGASSAPAPKRDPTEMLAEVLDLVRSLAASRTPLTIAEILAGAAAGKGDVLTGSALITGPGMLSPGAIDSARRYEFRGGMPPPKKGVRSIVERGVAEIKEGAPKEQEKPKKEDK